MNEKLKQEKIGRFLADQAMSASVKEVLLATFLKNTKEHDVHYLAAARLAIDLLQEGWRELDRYRSENRERPGQSPQPGM